MSFNTNYSLLSPYFTNPKAKPFVPPANPSAMSISAQKSLAAKTHAFQQQTIQLFSKPSNLAPQTSITTVVHTAVHQTIYTFPCSTPITSLSPKANCTPSPVNNENSPLRNISRDAFIPMLLEEANRLAKLGVAAFNQKNLPFFTYCFSNACLLVQSVLDGHSEDVFDLLHCVPFSLKLTSKEHTALLSTLKKFWDARHALDPSKPNFAKWQAVFLEEYSFPIGTASLPGSTS